MTEPNPTGARPRGRPKGSKNKVSKEARDFCRRLTKDVAYRTKLREDLQRRKNVPPAVETMVWAYAHGKPVEQIELESHGGAGALSGPITIVVNGKTYTSGTGGHTDK